MHFFKTLLVAASGLALAAAQAGGNIQFTTTFMSINAGKPVPITWTGGSSSSPVTIILRAGNPNNLDTVMTITSSATGGSYSWTPPTDLPVRTDYALEIKQGTGDNYSNQFAILGGTGTALPNASTTGAVTVTGTSTVYTTTATLTDSSATSAAASTTARNSTLSTSATVKASKTAETSSSSSSSNTSVPNANGAAAGLASPLALVLSAVMAMIYLH